MKILIYITLIIKFYAQNTIFFPIKIFQNLAMIEISISNQKINLLYIPTSVKTNGRFLISPYNECDLIYKQLNYCYYGLTSKMQNYKDNVKVYQTNYNGYIYNNYISINQINLGEMEYLNYSYSGKPGIISFDEDLLKILKQQKIISNKIIIFKEDIKNDDNIINVEIGKKYDINKFLSYDTCKMINEIYACKLNALAFSSSFNNYENTINVIYSDIKQINVAFFSYKICKNCLFGKKKIILEFIKNLNPQFNCSISKDNLCYFCDPIDNKIGFFIFGNSGIKFEKLILNIDEELDDYLYFSFHTIENLGFIIDQEEKKIVFTSNSHDIIISKKSSSTIKTIVFILFIEWIIIILYIICNKAY